MSLPFRADHVGSLLSSRVVLGLVSSKRPALEHKKDLLRRINDAAKRIRLEQLALSPQCGFASTWRAIFSLKTNSRPS
jgi:methionine synthase II (cobalamin-independent)